MNNYYLSSFSSHQFVHFLFLSKRVKTFYPGPKSDQSRKTTTTARDATKTRSKRPLLSLTGRSGGWVRKRTTSQRHSGESVFMFWCFVFLENRPHFWRARLIVHAKSSSEPTYSLSLLTSSSPGMHGHEPAYCSFYWKRWVF